MRCIYLAMIILFLSISGWAESYKPNVLDPIVVTANRFEERLGTTPGAFTVISTDDLEDGSVRFMEDLNGLAPNFSYSTQGGRSTPGIVNIRGLANLPAGGKPAVALYVDDVPVMAADAYEIALLDIERVEVLRGPQGSLYGLNAEAGVINIVGREASDVWHAEGGTEVGDWDRGLFRAMLRGPLVEDRLYVSVAGQRESRSGVVWNEYLDEDADPRDSLSGRLQLRIIPTQDLGVTFTVSSEDIHDGGGILNLPVDRDAYNRRYGTDLEPFEISTDYGGSNDAWRGMQALRVVYDLDALRVFSVTGHRESWSRTDADTDFTAQDSMRYNMLLEDESWTQELRLTSKEAMSPQTWQAGVFLSHRNIFGQSIVDFGTEQAMVPPGTRWTRIKAEGEGDAAAVFGQAACRFLDDKAGLTFGLRYEQYKESNESRSNFRNIPAFLSSLLPDKRMEGSFAHDVLLPKIVADYRPLPDLMVYTSIAMGYKPGGFNPFQLDETSFIYDMERNWTYELGARIHWLDGKAQTSLALFHMDVRDYQDIVSLDPSGFRATSLSLVNAARAESNGLEIEIKAVPVPGLTISASAGLIDAHYRDYESYDEQSGRRVSFDGNAIALTPSYTGSLSGRYLFPGGLYLWANLWGHGRSYFDQANRESQEPFQILDVKVGWDWDWFDVYLFGKNLCDQEYFTYAVRNQDLFFGVPGERRLLGIGLTARF
jgi:iron complex outermembrane receptor protein